MTEYIEREDVINDIGELFTICRETDPNECGHHFIVEDELQTHLDFVRNLPAADVVEVVRCRDCIYNRGESKDLWGNPAIVCATAVEHAPDWYCASGKRKDGWRDDA